MLYGCTYNVARDMIIKDRDDDFVKLIMEKYKALDGEFDLLSAQGLTLPALLLRWNLTSMPR